MPSTHASTNADARDKKVLIHETEADGRSDYRSDKTRAKVAHPQREDKRWKNWLRWREKVSVSGASQYKMEQCYKMEWWYPARRSSARAVGNICEREIDAG